MDDLLSEFLTETAESLAVLDLELVKLEQNPNDPELISNIFRLVHTIKGTCGFLGLPRLESVAHAGENVLGKLRDGEIEVSPAAVSLILSCLDCVRGLLAALEQNEAEPEGNDQDLIDRLNAFAESGGTTGVSASEEPAPEASVEEPAAEPDPEPEPEPLPVAAKPAVVGTIYERLGGLSVIDAVVEVMFQHIMEDDALKGLFQTVNMDVLQGKQRAFYSKILGGPDECKGDVGGGPGQPLAPGFNEGHFAAYKAHLLTGLKTLEVAEDVVADTMAALENHRDMIIGHQDEDEAELEEAVAKPKSVRAKGQSGQAKSEAKSATKSADSETPKESSVANQSIRVNVDLLENLMTMVSELVLTRNQVLQILRTQKDSEFAAPLQRLNHITSELQEGVMKTRMQPIGNAWSKLPRIVRDLAHELDKKIDLQMIGAETELDRQVLEMIKDPLTHMVRNSADHGLETAAERRRAGKPETGKITLNAYHEGGHIIIEISDDGRGLAIEKIKKKAIENGLATENELEQMTVQQIQQFIFKAGFSTASKVTNVSGRGVGMDVVRTNIEKIGGTVELRSTEGKGSTFIIKIPLTLAIVSALIVECCGERFAIPQISVVELVRVSANSEHKIERIKEAPVLRLRNRLLPLVSLRRLLRLGGDDGRVEQEVNESFVVVSQVGTYTFGIMVDRVYDTEEIVVKPVAPILRDITMFSGNTILGDGSVIMILDPNGIAAASGEMNVLETDGVEQSGHRDARAGERVPLLLFRAGDQTPKAVPLGLVARLEEVDVKSIEQSNGQLVVQYRGQLMPLVPLDPAYQVRESGRQPVLVFSDRDRSMGLIVDEIVDIVEDRLQVELSSERPGHIGSAIIAGKATDLVDAGYYLTQAFQDWFKAEGPVEGGEGAPKRILLVDDSPFFRNLLAPLLSVAGYEVTTAENADKALSYYEAGEDFDAIISDIEMPGMNGFQFAAAVKNSIRWQKTPIVALSSHASAKDLDRGRAVGFDDYVAKFDRDALLQTLHDTLSDMRGAA